TYIAQGGLRGAIADYLEHGREDVEQMTEYLAEHSPFRKGERQQEQD
ncbi:GNAT family N-acetyltransferase, partial [Neorhizobium galegae]|nr:GNAT family N-acetyltransferase [Neorhizobium galegae]